MIDTVFGAIAQAAPERALGGPFATINALVHDRPSAERQPVGACSASSAAGLAARPHGDGLNHGNNPISTATIPPVEILEAANPMIFTRWALRPDSAGPGVHRGGLGRDL